MQIDYDVLPEILLYTSLFLLIYYSFYKQYIYSVLDPLFIYVFTISFSSVLVIYTLSDRPLYIIHFFLCHLFLFIGFVLTSYGFRDRRQNSEQIIADKPINLYDYKILEFTVYCLLIIYFLANIVLFYTTGFALLSDDPTTAKVENFAKGYGIILKINWGIGGFITAGLVFLILSKTHRRDLFLLLVVIILTALEGSKSSLLRILIIFILLANHSVFSYRRDVIDKLKMIIPLGIIALLTIFFTVLFKENADSEQALFAFFRRLLYGADSTLYFYLPVNEQYFARFRFWEFPGHLFNQILGFLRLVSYQEALGNVMVENALPSFTGTIVGPNTPYYIEGQIYFGYYGAFIYSAVVGGCYAFIRQYFFNAKYYSAFWLVLICCLCQHAGALSIEVTLFLTQAFDTCFFVIPVYVFISLIMYGKVRLRKIHY